VGRVATVVVVLLGIGWIPIMQNISGVLYEYLQSVQSYIAPPITAVFLLGVFSKRINARGAFVTLAAGMAVGFLRIALELNLDALAPGGWLHTLGSVNFLTFASWFFLFCVCLCVLVSLSAPAPSPDKIQGLTMGTLSAEQRQLNRASYNAWDILLSLVVIALVAGVMIGFAG
jgi:SSS family solute:Na+ symporter